MIERNKDRNDKLLAKGREIAALLGDGWTLPDPREGREDDDNCFELNYLTFHHAAGGSFGGWIDTYRNRSAIADGGFGKGEFGLEWPYPRTFRNGFESGGKTIPAWKSVIENKKGYGHRPANWREDGNPDNIEAGVSMDRAPGAIAKDLTRRLRLAEFPAWYAEVLAAIKDRLGKDDANARERIRRAKMIDPRRTNRPGEDTVYIDVHGERPLYAIGSLGKAEVKLGNDRYESDEVVATFSGLDAGEFGRLVRFLKSLDKAPAAPEIKNLEFDLAA